jgi:nucleotidyltransferase/DNA polymerase involved in DNA repair
MHYFLYVELHGFFVQTVREGSHTLRGPLLIARKKVVLDAEHTLKERGITIGMPLSEARCLATDAHVYTYEPEEFRIAREAWMTDCCRFSNAVESIDDHRAWVDLSGHADPVSIALELRKHLRYPVQIGLGTTRWIAEAVSHELLPETPELVAQLQLCESIENPFTMIQDWPISHLYALTTDERLKMLRLGCDTIRSLLALPHDVLKELLGESARCIQYGITHSSDAPVLAEYPKDHVSEYRFFPDGVEDRLQLEQLLREISSSVSQKLIQKDCSASGLSIEFHGDDFGCLRFERIFNRALQSHGSLWGCLFHVIAEWPTSIVTSVLVKAYKLSQAKQRQIDCSSRYVSTRTLDDSISTVRGVFGDGSVLIASQMVDSRRKQVLKVWKDALGWN